MKFPNSTRTAWKHLIKLLLILIFPAYSFGQATCATATLLTVNGNCTSTTGQTLRGGNATLAAQLPATAAPCGSINANSPDNWYRFIATTAYPEIRLSNIGSDL